MGNLLINILTVLFLTKKKKFADIFLQTFEIFHEVPKESFLFKEQSKYSEVAKILYNTALKYYSQQ